MKAICCIFFFLYFYGCNSVETGVPVIHFKLSDTVPVSLSEIAGKVKRIDLEVTEESLVGEINQVVVCGDKILVLDFTTTLFMFDSTGRFIRRVGEKGRGPREYLYLNNVTADERNGVIYVNDSRKMMKYDPDGNFMDEISFPGYHEYLSFVNDTLYCISSIPGEKTGSYYRSSAYMLTLNNKFEKSDSLNIREVYLKSMAASSYPKKHFLSGAGGELFVYYPVLLKEPFVRDTLYRVAGHREIVPFLSLAADYADKEKTLVYNMYRAGKYLFMEMRSSGREYLVIYDPAGAKLLNAGGSLKDDFYHTGPVKKIYPLANAGFYFLAQDETGGNPVLFIGNLKKQELIYRESR